MLSCLKELVRGLCDLCLVLVNEVAVRRIMSQPHKSNNMISYFGALMCFASDHLVVYWGLKHCICLGIIGMHFSFSLKNYVRQNMDQWLNNT